MSRRRPAASPLAVSDGPGGGPGGEGGAGAEEGGVGAEAGGEGSPWEDRSRSQAGFSRRTLGSRLLTLGRFSNISTPVMRSIVDERLIDERGREILTLRSR